MGNAKLVNATQLSAQSVRGAFAIVKAMGREDLGIIKKRRICSEKFLANLKGTFVQGESRGQARLDYAERSRKSQKKNVKKKVHLYQKFWRYDALAVNLQRFWAFHIR